jgi:hypothetical protein
MCFCSCNVGMFDEGGTVGRTMMMEGDGEETRRDEMEQMMEW